MINYWIASGDFDSWYEGFDFMRRQGKMKHAVWAVTEEVSKRVQKIDKEDIVAFYVTEPVKGITGFGRVTRVYVREKGPIIWKEEELKGITHPFTIELEILWLAPHIYSGLSEETIPWLRPFVQAGLNRIADPEYVKEMQKIFNLVMSYNEILSRISHQ